MKWWGRSVNVTSTMRKTYCRTKYITTSIPDSIIIEPKLFFFTLYLIRIFFWNKKSNARNRIRTAKPSIPTEKVGEKLLMRMPSAITSSNKRIDPVIIQPPVLLLKKRIAPVKHNRIVRIDLVCDRISFLLSSMTSPLTLVLPTEKKESACAAR